MIQRIQSIYLFITIVILSIVTFSTTFFSYVNATSRYSFTSYGITEYTLIDNNFVEHKAIPLYISTIGLTLLTFICLMSYKNIKRQRKLGRSLFLIYLLFVVGLTVWSMYGDAMLNVETSGREMGLGFLIFMCGLPFTFLANLGIKRDSNLLDSLDRLR